MKPQNLVLAAITVLIAVGLSFWIVMPSSSASKPAVPALASPGSPATPAASAPADSLEIKAPQPTSQPSGAAPASTTTPAITNLDDVRHELPTLIGGMVRCLDSGDLTTFLRLSASPEKLQAMLSANNITLDQLVHNAVLQRCFIDQMKSTRETLNSIQFATPTYNAAGDTATFVLSPQPATGPKQIIFNKVNGLWYVQN